jgi:protein-disulfide isomerase
MRSSVRAWMAALMMGVSVMTPLVAAHAQEEVPQDVPMFVKSPVLDLQKTDHVLGDNKAPITIVEYASLSCTHCAHFHKDILPQLKKAYIDTGKVRLILRSFPLNDPALKGAVLLNCLDPEQYYTFAKVLFELQEKWAFDEKFLQNLQQISSVGGVSAEKFGSCMSNVAIEKQVLEDRKKAEEELKIRSTPTFFVNGHRIEGARDITDFELMIQKVTAGMSKPDAKN